jgi:hypothetical protein
MAIEATYPRVDSDPKNPQVRPSQEETTTNVTDRTHTELPAEQEKREREVGIIDKEGNRAHPAATFMLIAFIFIASAALALFVISIVL